MTSILNELPTALRRLSRAPGFSLAVVSFLALAIAALLAMAAVGYGLLWRPFGIPDDDRVVAIDGWSKAMGFSLGISAPLVPELTGVYDGIQSHGVWDWRQSDGDVDIAALSSGALATLGVRPQLGRWLAAEDAATDDAVLISDAFWRSHFGGASDVLGRKLELHDREYRVVGVMPASFHFPDLRPDVWVPRELTPADLSPDNAGSFSGLQVVARLAPGADMAALQQALRQRYDSDERIKWLVEHMQMQFRAVSLRESLGEDRRDAVALLAAAAALVVLTTLANLANLWLGRGLQRQRELAIATALGASAKRTGASVLSEVLVLTMAASALGLVLAPAVVAGLRLAGVLDERSPLVVAIDAPIAALAVLAALVIALLLAAPVYWLIRRVTGFSALRQGQGMVSERPGVARLRHGLIAVQVAVSVALLGAGGLMLRSLDALRTEGAGFASDGLLLGTARAPRVGGQTSGRGAPDPADVAKMQALYRALQADTALRVSFANAPPFSGSESVGTVRIEALGDQAEQAAKYRQVGPGYFSTLGVPLREGREMTAADATGEKVVVVDERFAARWFAGREALGQSIGIPNGENEFVPARIVGIAGAVKQATLDEKDMDGTFFLPLAEPQAPSVDFLVRTALPLADVKALLERNATAEGLDVARVASVDALVQATLRERISLLGMVGGFALFGTALASLGLYAVLAFATRRRAAEFGLKLALGAQGTRIARDVVRDAWRIVLPGFVLAIPAAYGAVRAIEARLYGVHALDPVTWAIVLAAVAILVLASALLPARRAASVDPMRTLRHD